MRITRFAPVALTIVAGFPQQPARDPGNFVIQSSVREVLLEVSVRDSHGKLVTKLDPKQFAIYEDGVRQEVLSFRLVTGKEVRAVDEASNTAVTTRREGGTERRPIFNSLRTVNVVCLVLADLTAETRAFAFNSARKFVESEVRPDTFIGVFSMDAAGLRPVFPFSNSRERLLKAVELAAVNQLPSISGSSAAMLNGLSMAVATPLNPDASNDGTDDLGAASPLGTRGAMGFSVNAGLRELDALRVLVRQLSALPFQKSVVLMGTGLTRPPDQQAYWQGLIAAARKGAVTFYGVDVWGLGSCQDNPDPDCASGNTTDTSTALLQKGAQLSQGQKDMGLHVGPTQGAISGPGPPPGGVAMESMKQGDYVRFGVLSANRQEAFRDLTESTGGFLIANTNNDKLLSKIMDEVDTHFVLAYRPMNPLNDGRFRKIEVKIDRPNLRAETRDGYYAVPDSADGPLTPADIVGLRALNAKPVPHAFDFHSKAFRFRSSKEGSQYAIAFEVPIASLTETPVQGRHMHSIHASMLALVKNDKGEVVDTIARDVPSAVDDAYLPSLRTNFISYERAVNLKPGRYTVETAVVDQEANRASTNTFEIDSLEHEGLSVSDLALVRRFNELKRPLDAADPFEAGSRRAQPYLTPSLGSTARAEIFFVVYPDASETAVASMKAQVLRDGKMISEQSSVVPQADLSGAVPMMLESGANPGEYEVRIVVEQGSSRARGNLKYTVAK